MTDRDAHVRAIVAAPDDAAPRLVFADWLEDHGEPWEREAARWLRLPGWWRTEGGPPWLKWYAPSEEGFIAVGDGDQLGIRCDRCGTMYFCESIGRGWRCGNCRRAEAPVVQLGSAFRNLGTYAQPNWDPLFPLAAGIERAAAAVQRYAAAIGRRPPLSMAERLRYRAWGVPPRSRPR